MANMIFSLTYSSVLITITIGTFHFQHKTKISLSMDHSSWSNNRNKYHCLQSTQNTLLCQQLTKAEERILCDL